MMLGGMDVSFPDQAVADWDFFFRCELAGLKCYRAPHVFFYHFGSATISRSDVVAVHKPKEQASYAYFEWKWGFRPGMDITTHNKRPVDGQSIRGFSL